MAGVNPYNFDPAFERAVVYLCASRPRFWARVGASVDPDSLGTDTGKMVLLACRLMARDYGHGPGGTVLVIQRFMRLLNEGKLSKEDVDQAVDYFDAAEDFGVPDEEAVVAELTPVLRRRMQQQAIISATDSFSRKGDMTNVKAMLEKAERVGQVATLGGTRVGAKGFSEIDALSNLTRLPSGILELDINLNDGMARGEMGVVMGDSGGGKSQFLISVAAEAMRQQLFAGVATLELPKTVQLARVYANLTGIATNLILDNVQDRAEAQRRTAIMEPQIGVCVIEDFPPHATTVADLIAWIEYQEQEVGRKMDVLVVDYGDKLYDPRIKGDNEYLAMRYVYEGLRRDISAARHMWVWTASQASRPSKESAKRLDLHHVADSMHKVRVADLIITLNPKDEGLQMMYYVAKNRTGRSRFQVGPLPTDWERGRSAPFAREWADWTVV